MTNPNPVRSAMLNGRKKFGERLINISLYTALEIRRKISCQKIAGIILDLTFEFMI
jgi:hypothetical protein